ncbi:hypothetical protein [Nocardioides sp. R-C-SC26]|uniref:hypothetical protein n=1 Tax=Nocardioides sp. R-C-SC26 TaxID=2870414 RepID=UPI001E49FCF6|nr:hypothetical protein [Nocardioides sp. R-C-SC26]
MSSVRSKMRDVVLAHPVITFALVGLLLVAVPYPFAVRMDERSDRMRPMYLSVEEVTFALFQAVRSSGEVPDVAGAVTIEHGRGRAAVGEVEIRQTMVRRGVVVEVTSNGEEYCVTGRNEHGDTAVPDCGDGQEERTSPTG